jgi:hypothetical protein
MYTHVNGGNGYQWRSNFFAVLLKLNQQIRSDPFKTFKNTWVAK